MYPQSQLDQIWNHLKDGKFANALGACPKIIADDPHEQTMSVPISERTFHFSRRPNTPWVETRAVGGGEFSGVMRHPTQLAGAFRAGEHLNSIELQHLLRAGYLTHDHNGNLVLTPYAIHELSSYPPET